MADCECIPKCPFFHDKMASLPGMAALMKKRFCQGDNKNCARWVVRSALGPTAVPADLFPNQLDRAQGIIAGKAR